MTPHAYLEQIDELISKGRDEEALDLAARFSLEIMPLLSAEEFFRVSAALEGAELAVSTSDARQSAAESDAWQPARHTA